MTEAGGPSSGVMAGLSTGAYALALAAMATLQSGADQALIEDRAPAVEMIDEQPQPTTDRPRRSMTRRAAIEPWRLATTRSADPSTPMSRHSTS